jgi:hypothetical protein
MNTAETVAYWSLFAVAVGALVLATIAIRRGPQEKLVEAEPVDSWDWPVFPAGLAATIAEPTNVVALFDHSVRVPDDPRRAS